MSEARPTSKRPKTPATPDRANARPASSVESGKPARRPAAKGGAAKPAKVGLAEPAERASSPAADAAIPVKSRIEGRREKALNKGAESYQERRREIAKVAAELFNKDGFRGTSLAAVADALKTNRASLYYYIANKRELYDEVVREVSEGNVATAQAVYASKASPLEKLRALIIEMMKSYAEHYPLLYVYIRENLSHVESERTDWSRYMRRLNRQYEEVYIKVIQQGIDDGSIRPLGSPRVMAFGIIGMTGWTNRWFVPGKSDVDGEAIGRTFAEMVLGGLKA